MQKIWIVGIVASGKTTLARQLSARTGIDWYELDDVVHQRSEKGHKRTPEQQLEIIRSIDRNGSWILEGTDRSSYSYLYDMADTVLFFDPPLWKRRIRIVTRWIKQKTGQETADYKPDLAMLKMMFCWTNEFERTRPDFEQKLARYGDKVLRITDQKAVRRLLDKAESTGDSVERQK
ncbi:hypothetical protein [Saccharibacillus qingshengii]|uniref:hypothetical protein n=1 Tax=Saccharibacillus qingshengii TaxID=1763540 RepID=UPI001551F20B|nr:hypothetical protein [Saccharibacillus qingshengii]